MSRNLLEATRPARAGACGTDDSHLLCSFDPLDPALDRFYVRSLRSTYVVGVILGVLYLVLEGSLYRYPGISSHFLSFLKESGIFF